MAMQLHNPEIENAALGIVVQHPDTFADFYLISETDFSPTLRPIWAVINQQLTQTPPGSISPIAVAEKLKSYSIKLDGFEPSEYLQGLMIKCVRKEDAAPMARELKRISIRRELITKAEEAKQKLIADKDATFEQMTRVVETTLSSINTEYYKGSEFTNVFDGIIEQTEARAANPIDPMEMGYMGPFPTINKTLGALCVENQWVTIGARTGNQKSALGFYYNLCIAEKYDLPILLLDVGEMTIERIRRRAVCCMAEGKVPLWAVASGAWSKNKEWTHIIRDIIWPRVRKLRIDFISIGNLSPKQKITLIRRYAYSKVGRGKPFGILDDYLKGIEALGKNSAEHQTIGYYVQEAKSLITNELPAWYWTSVQNNRTGTYQGKKASEITDSEDQMGLSDRIIQQSDWGFILRFKTTEEQALENDLFGNMRLTPVKTREALGREYEKALRPVKLGNGRWVPNHYNLASESFHFTEKGDLHQVISTLGLGNVSTVGTTPPAAAL